MTKSEPSPTSQATPVDGTSLGNGDLHDVQPFIDAGWTVLAPTYRGENGNPGTIELWLGEVQDAASTRLQIVEMQGDHFSSLAPALRAFSSRCRRASRPAGWRRRCRAGMLTTSLHRSSHDSDDDDDHMLDPARRRRRRVCARTGVRGESLAGGDGRAVRWRVR
jgi:hypothetical protein